MHSHCLNFLYVSVTYFYSMIPHWWLLLWEVLIVLLASIYASISYTTILLHYKFLCTSLWSYYFIALFLEFTLYWCDSYIIYTWLLCIFFVLLLMYICVCVWLNLLYMVTEQKNLFLKFNQFIIGVIWISCL